MTPSKTNANYMKYIISRGGTLHYQRAFPKHLQGITGRAFYQSLKLHSHASADEIQALRDNYNRQFEQIVATALASLASNNQVDDTNVAMLKIMRSQQQQRSLSLNDIWHSYCEHKRLRGREKQVADIDWQRFIRVAGNLSATDDNDTNRRINAALQAQFQMRQNSVKASTAKRELSRVIAALKYGAHRHQIYWRIDPIKLNNPSKATKATSLTHSEIASLLSQLGNDTSATDVDGLICLALTLGMTPAETARIHSNDIQLNMSIPYITVRNSKNQPYRQAIAPLAQEFLSHSIEGAIYLARMSKGYVSRMISHRLEHILQQDNIGMRHLLNTYRDIVTPSLLDSDDLTMQYEKIQQSFEPILTQ